MASINIDERTTFSLSEGSRVFCGRIKLYAALKLFMHFDEDQLLKIFDSIYM